MKQSTSILRLILGDQLNHNHSWFKQKRSDVVYLIVESRSETDYVRHHIQKVVAFFLAMRSFADWLKDEGHHVLYLSLDNSDNRLSIDETIIHLVQSQNITHVEYQLPDEYRVDQMLSQLASKVKVPVSAVDSEHFLTNRSDLAQHFTGKKVYVMESFYRAMRRRYKILMDGDKPLGEKWNFDQENRKKLPKDVIPPPPCLFTNDAADIIRLLAKQGVKTIGSIDRETLNWPTNRSHALTSLEYFCRHLLQNFGDYQDAMHTEHRNLFHSRLSFALNVKLISPLEIIQRVIQEWQKRPKLIELHQVEGFVRQILGWREYMRGIYWAHMPSYATLNYFEHARPLPEFYWSGKTKMNCLHHAITQSLEDAYAHHIQRLMITGNFALLAGIDPSEVDAWYLGIYIDAIEWVEITNTRGMSQYADGGIVGTKPYTSTANYVHKMSNYCTKCHYDREKRHGERACPFNSLYWNFYLTHREKIGKNPRNGMVYRQLEKMTGEERDLVTLQAKKYLDEIDSL